jgi:hypothetical protein
MKATHEENEKRIDKLQTAILKLRKAHDIIGNEIGDKQDELQAIQSENAIMAEEMKAGKHIES